MTDQLPEHLSVFVTELDKAHSMANLDNRACPVRLRAILRAACAVAEEAPIELSQQDLNPLCAYCGVLLFGWEEHLPECLHRQLDEALNDD